MAVGTWQHRAVGSEVSSLTAGRMAHEKLDHLPQLPEQGESE